MAKRKDVANHGWMSGLSFRSLLLHPATLFLAASTALIGGAIHLWHAHQDDIVAQEHFLLTPAKVVINTPPKWSDADLKEVVLGELATANHATVSLLDPALVSKTASVFESVGWVEKVRHVKKTRDGLSIDLIYRGAVGMVELNRTTVPDWPLNEDGQLLPVDRLGVIMPGAVAAEQSLLRFSIFNPNRFTSLTPWSEWPDRRVADAASISAVIHKRWQDWGVYRIVTFRRPESPDDHNVPFELWPASGTQIVWGNPPGEESTDEASAEKKIQVIDELVAKFGPLSQLEKCRIDVRSGKAIVSRKTKTASLGFRHLSRQ